MSLLKTIVKPVYQSKTVLRYSTLVVWIGKIKECQLEIKAARLGHSTKVTAKP